MQLVIFGLFVFCLQRAHYCDPWKPNYSSLLLWHFAFKKAVKAACSAGGLCLDRSVPQEKLATAQTLIWLWERAIVLKSTFELFHKPESKRWWSVPTSFWVFFLFFLPVKVSWRRGWQGTELRFSPSVNVAFKRRLFVQQDFLGFEE